MLTFSSNYSRVAHDAAGNAITEGCYVASLSCPGDHREAPVYRIACVCTDSHTLILTRADGSHIYRLADEVLFLPETTAANQPRT